MSSEKFEAAIMVKESCLQFKFRSCKCVFQTVEQRGQEPSLLLPTSQTEWLRCGGLPNRVTGSPVERISRIRLEDTPEGWVGFLMHRGSVKQMQDGALENCSRAGQKGNNAPGKKI
ncbi:hypothetical protein B0H13DRAFT_1854804 [Mycena leptocephala]|nr:hypothetical protein B0H13DRAFT_1854804 [Mycena leptocephala]